MDLLPDDVIKIIINYNVPILSLCSKRYLELINNIDRYYLINNYSKVYEYFKTEVGDDHSAIYYNGHLIWKLSITENHPVIIKIDSFLKVLVILKVYKPIYFMKLTDIINIHQRGKLKIYSITIVKNEKIYKWYTTHYTYKKCRIENRIYEDFFRYWEKQIINYVFDLTDWNLGNFIDDLPII